jgi:hypothetical protein
MFKHLIHQAKPLALCAAALLLASSPAQAQRTQGGQQRESEIRVSGDRAQALIKTKVENFELTEMKVRCGDEWIDLQDGSIDEETLMRILEWSDWLTASGADWVKITSTTATVDFQVQKDVIESIESFSGGKADAFCSFLRDLGIVGLP